MSRLPCSIICVNGRTSSWFVVSSGVHQGSVLDSVLFITCMNGLPEVVGLLCEMCADDTTSESERERSRD